MGYHYFDPEVFVNEPIPGQPPCIKLLETFKIEGPRAQTMLATDIRALDLPRREIPNWMADRLFGFEGYIVDQDGKEIAFDPEAIDMAFNDEQSFRWISDFVRWAEVPPKQKAQLRVQRRLQLLTLALAIDLYFVRPERRYESYLFPNLVDGIQLSSAAIGTVRFRWNPVTRCHDAGGSWLLGRHEYSAFVEEWFSRPEWESAVREMRRSESAA